MADDFGDINVPFEDSIRDVLPEKLRSLTCGYPGDDHGHTSCYFFVLAANEIDRLRERLQYLADLERIGRLS